MVRKGSPVRVRQRALLEAPQPRRFRRSREAVKEGSTGSPGLAGKATASPEPRILRKSGPEPWQTYAKARNLFMCAQGPSKVAADEFGSCSAQAPPRLPPPQD